MRLPSFNIESAEQVTCPEYVPLDSHESYCLKNLLVARSYMEAQNGATLTLIPGEPLLQIGFTGIGPSEWELRLESNMKRICDMRSGHPDSPSCIHHPHSVTPAHGFSGVGWPFTAIFPPPPPDGRKGIRREDAVMRVGGC